MATNVALQAYKAGQRSEKKSSGKRSKAGITVPLSVVAGFAPLVMHIKSRVQGGDGWIGGVSKGLQTGFGYNPDTGRWGIGNAMLGVIPIAVGMLVHKGANKLGFNRTLQRMGLPVIRI